MHRKARLVAAACLALVGVVSAVAAPGLDAKFLLASTTYIGLGVMDASDEAARRIGLVEPHGIEISSVAEGGPGEDAGLQAGDIVLTYRGERVNGYEHFARLVRETPAGRTVELGIVRGGQRRTIRVEIRSRESHATAGRVIDSVRERLDALKADHEGFALSLSIPRIRMNFRDQNLGVDVEELEGQLADYFGVERGLLVREVRDGTPAARAGLVAGDVIVSVDGQSVSKPGDLARTLPGTRSRSVELRIVRDRKAMDVELAARAGREALRTRPIVHGK